MIKTLGVIMALLIVSSVVAGILITDHNMNPEAGEIWEQKPSTAGDPFKRNANLSEYRIVDTTEDWVQYEYVYGDYVSSHKFSAKFTDFRYRHRFKRRRAEQ